MNEDTEQNTCMGHEDKQKERNEKRDQKNEWPFHQKEA